MSSFRIFPSILESIKLAYKHKILWVFALVVTGATYTSQFTFFNEVDQPQEDIVSHLIDRNPEIKASISNSSYSSSSSHLLAANTENSPGTILSPSESLDTNFTDDDIIINDSQLSPDSDGAPLTLSSRDYVFFQALQLLQTLGPNEYLELFLPNIVLLIVTALIGVSIAMAVGFIVTSWSYSSLIKGCVSIINNASYSLKELGEFGVSNWSQVLKFKLWAFLFFILLFIVSSVLVVSPIVILPEGYVSSILAVLLFIISFFAFILLHYSVKFGSYFILVGQESFKEALISGFYFAKKNIWRTILLEITSGILVAIVVSLLLGLLRIVATYGVLFYPNVVEFVYTNLALIIPVSLFVGAIAFVIMLFIVIFSGYVSTYNHILWTKFFLALNIEDKEVINNA